MNILQLCYKPPYPPVDGGTMAMNGVTQGLLSCGHAVRVLSVSSDKHPISEFLSGSEYEQKTHFQAVHIDLSIHPLDAATALLCGESYNVKRFYNKAFEKKLIEILDSHTFDIVHIESIFLAPYLDTIRRHSNARLVLRAHNVEHLIWQQMAKNEKKPLKRWYLKHLALALRQYELRQMNLFDGIVCISDNDAATFRELGCRKKIISIPFGIDLPPIPNSVPEPLSLFHVGSMDWLPNQESISWFLNKVWPLIHNDLPQMRLYLAGRKMPDKFLNLNLDGVVVVGEVPDSKAFMASKQINIVPLLSGSGIRIKIIEAMALGKAIISTSAGASGIKYTDGHDILIANTPEEFLSHLCRLTENPELGNTLGRNARCLVEEQYSQQAMANKLLSFYETLL